MGSRVWCEDNQEYTLRRAAVDPKPKYTIDRYQVVQSHDVIKINATFPSRPNNTSAIDYLLNTARPRASTPCNWNTDFATSIPTVAMPRRVSPFFLEEQATSFASYSPDPIA